MAIGLDRVGERFERVWDAFVASDPGLLRLRQAVFTALAMSGALALEFGLSRATGAAPMETIVAMLLGTMVAMIGANALPGTGMLPSVRTAALFPVAMGAGITLGALVGRNADVVLSVFVAVMFVAAWVRRFGAAYSFYGFMFWMGYFFATFLHAGVSMVPRLLLAVLLGTVWVLLLAVTVARVKPGRALLRVRRSFDARARHLIRSCARLVTVDPDDRRRLERQARRVRARRGAVAEAALMIDGWSADRGALPGGWTGPAVRRRLVDLQLCLGEIAAASLDLAGAPEAVRAPAADTLRALAEHRTEEAGGGADRLHEMCVHGRIEEPGVRRAAFHLALGVRDYARLEPDVAAPPTPDADAGPDEEFTPSVALVMGNLPGSPALVRDVPPRGHHWNPLSRLDFTTRQAVQVAVAGALAIVFGRMVSPYRYYWAVIAAFVVFTGTGTRSETALKASNRIIGTLVGLVAGILLAHLTDGRTIWILVVVVVSMACGFYLIRISYAYMIFFVTIMVAQLYSVLHEFSDELLLLRLKETAIGGAIGIIVGLLVTPVSTRDAVELVRRDLLTALADFLRAVAAYLTPGPVVGPARSDPTHGPVVRPTQSDPTLGPEAPPLPDLDALLREMDKQLRALAQIAAPLTKPLLAANSPRRARHRLTLYGETVRTAQVITRAVRATADTDEHLADAADALATVAGRYAGLRLPLGAAPPGAPADVVALLRQADAALDAADPPPGPLRSARFDLERVRALFGQLVQLPPSGSGANLPVVGTVDLGG